MASKSEVSTLKSKILRPRLRPPQFGMRSMLLAVAVCCVLLAIVRLHWLSPIGLGALCFLALSIFCHMAGNAIGKRLRQIGDQPQGADDERTPSRTRQPRPQDFAPATHLSQRRSLGWSIIIATSVGVTCGAIGGGLWTFLASRGQAGSFPIAIGVIAFAVLGGLASFATVGLAQVLFGAIRQALQPSPNLTTGDAPHDSAGP